MSLQFPFLFYRLLKKMEIGSKENRKSIYFFPVGKNQENEFFFPLRS